MGSPDIPGGRRIRGARVALDDNRARDRQRRSAAQPGLTQTAGQRDGADTRLAVSVHKPLGRSSARCRVRVEIAWVHGGDKDYCVQTVSFGGAVSAWVLDSRPHGSTPDGLYEITCAALDLLFGPERRW
ncbi:hypothetical protein A9975_16500 [Cupriavidus sp. UME77]|nr:hypothetical protein [Cupriavidus sp. UME77]